MISRNKSGVDVLVRELQKRRGKVPDRPEGFHTVKEMAWAMVESGEAQGYAAAKSCVDRLIDILDHEGRLEKIKVAVHGPSGKRVPCTAFKILPEGK